MYIIIWDSALLWSDCTTDVFSAIADTEVINEESDVVESEELGPMIIGSVGVVLVLHSV